MGQSAPGGIIQHLLAEDAEGRDVPFSQAFYHRRHRPRINPSEEMTGSYDLFPNATGSADVQCLCSLSEEEMVMANEHTMLEAPQGAFSGPGFGFGPVIGDEEDWSEYSSARLEPCRTKNTAEGYVTNLVE